MSRSSRVLTAIALLAGATSGCAVNPPAAPELPFIPPSAWAGDAGDSPLPETGGAWWLRFEDSHLDALVDEALEASPTLAAAAARLEASMARARIAGADRLPSLAAGLDGGRRRQNFIGLPIPGAEGEVLSNTSTTVSASVDVSWEADLWGRLGAGQAAALARTEAAEADLAAVRNSLIGQVAKAWFGWIEAREQLRLAERTLDIRRRFREQIESRYVRGLRSPLDLRLAIANEANAEAGRVARSEAAAAAGRRLEVLLARYPAGERPDEGLPLTDPPPPVPVGQPAELLTRRPDLIAAERRMAASGLDVAAARAALYPRLRLNAAGGRSSNALEDLVDEDFSVWSLAAGFLQPIFQGGRLRAAVSAAEAARIEAAAGYLQAALRAFEEVEAALAAESFLAERLGALDRAAEQAAAARMLAEERYRAGLDEYLTVLEAQRQETSSRIQVLDVRRRRLEARVDLHLALGGDYDAAGASPRSGKAGS